jgi:Glutaminase
MKTFFLVMVFLSGVASAEILRIEHIDRGRIAGEPDHAYFSDGRVGVLEPDAGEKFNLAREAFRNNSRVDVTLDKNHYVTFISLVSGEDEPEIDLREAQPPKNEEVSVLPDLQSVNEVFKRMNRGWQKDSQCYNRAHVWNYEENNRTGLQSKKVFIFYTRRYIRDYNFKWWFHAIPTVLAYHQGTVVERFLDPMFAKTPLPKKAWTDIFIRSKRACPVITKYSDYFNNQETEHCYLHFSSMYFWQPRDLDTYERTGFQKTHFINSEINHAYWEAF